MLVSMGETISRIIKLALIGALSLLILGLTAGATTIDVPSDHTTIQGAIDAAVNDDTVLVAPGSYKENINFRGKNLVVTSHFALDQNTDFIYNTIIDAVPCFWSAAKGSGPRFRGLRLPGDPVRVMNGHLATLTKWGEAYLYRGHTQRYNTTISGIIRWSTRGDFMQLVAAESWPRGVMPLCRTMSS